MESISNTEWKMTGRVEFHLNGGITKVSFWAGGRQTVGIETSLIPLELRTLGTWLRLRLSSSEGWSVEGRGEPEPYLEAWLNRQPTPNAHN
jgi:hypothetical protein